MDAFTISQTLGILGFIGYMIGYAGQQFSLIDGQSMMYSFINLVSASLVLFSLMDQFNIASAMIQISWIAISIIGLFIRFSRKPATRAFHVLIKTGQRVNKLN